MKTKNIFLGITFALGMAACSGSGGQFSGWQEEVFETTAVTKASSTEIIVGNASTSDEQHLLAAGFLSSSNTDGHFRIDRVRVGGRDVEPTDIVIPPGSTLTLEVTYAPINLSTTVADYGGWVTGLPERWEPTPVSEVEAEEPEKEETIHRALLQLTYDKPREGIVYVHLVGHAVPGPEGEVAVGGGGGECIPGEGIACYTGGFALDIPGLIPQGPVDLVFEDSILMTFDGGRVTLRMEDFPPALMYLRSTEIPDLPPGVTATLIISGAPGKTATGTFDGSRLELKDVTFRIRVVLGELEPSAVTPGLSGIVDFNIEGLEITTIEPLAQGEITLRLETTLSELPSGNELFDQFLGGVDVIATLRGQLAF